MPYLLNLLEHHLPRKVLKWSITSQNRSLSLDVCRICTKNTLAEWIVLIAGHLFSYFKVFFYFYFFFCFFFCKCFYLFVHFLSAFVFIYFAILCFGWRIGLKSSFISMGALQKISKNLPKEWEVGVGWEDVGRGATESRAGEEGR